MDRESKTKSPSALLEISNGPYSLNKPPGWKQKQPLYSWVWKLVYFSPDTKGATFTCSFCSGDGDANIQKFVFSVIPPLTAPPLLPRVYFLMAYLVYSENSRMSQRTPVSASEASLMRSNPVLEADGRRYIPPPIPSNALTKMPFMDVRYCASSSNLDGPWWLSLLWEGLCSLSSRLVILPFFFFFLHKT